jgi:hypothetical protein
MTHGASDWYRMIPIKSSTLGTVRGDHVQTLQLKLGNVTQALPLPHHHVAADPRVCSCLHPSSSPVATFPYHSDPCGAISSYRKLCSNTKANHPRHPDEGRISRNPERISMIEHLYHHEPLRREMLPASA